MDGFGEQLAQIIEHQPWLAPLAALLGGLLTAANPCVLGMVPLMVAYVAEQKSQSARHSFLLSLTFTGGLTITFAALFLVSWGASTVLRAEWWTYLAAAVCLLMGLHLVGVIDWKVDSPRPTIPRRRGFVGAFLLGLLFGLVSLPCAGPVLLALLTVVPLKGVVFGAVLLGAYSLGHCGLVLVGGTSMAFVQRLIDSKGWQAGLRMMRVAAGGLIIVVGVTILLW